LILNLKKMKNKAYKSYLLRESISMSQDLTRILHWEIMEKNNLAFEIMEEAGADFTKEGYTKAAEMIKEQLN
jgi:hypothetical protein